jgi:hypothetical protein
VLKTRLTVGPLCPRLKGPVSQRGVAAGTRAPHNREWAGGRARARKRKKKKTGPRRENRDWAENEVRAQLGALSLFLFIFLLYFYFPFSFLF